MYVVLTSEGALSGRVQSTQSQWLDCCYGYVPTYMLYLGRLLIRQPPEVDRSRNRGSLGSDGQRGCVRQRGRSQPILRRKVAHTRTAIRTKMSSPKRTSLVSFISWYHGSNMARKASIISSWRAHISQFVIVRKENTLIDGESSVREHACPDFVIGKSKVLQTDRIVIRL